jgi:hypothetical protein
MGGTGKISLSLMFNLRETPIVGAEVYWQSAIVVWGDK